jgi:porin
MALAIIPLAMGAAARGESPDRDDVNQLETLHDYEEPDERSAHLEPDPLRAVLAPWQRFKEGLSERHGLDLLVTYTASAQIGSQSRRDFTAAHQVDLIGQWRLLDSPRWGQGAIEFSLAHFLTLGGVDATDFQESLGSSWLTNTFDTDPDSHLNEITFLWWDQRLFDDRLRVLVGKLDPTELVAQTRYIGDGQESFLATPLAEDPVLPFLETQSLGALARVVRDDFYASFMISDATATRNGLDFDSVTDGKWQQALEVGWTPILPEVGAGAYRVTAFHVPRVGSGDDEASGWSFAASFDQDVGEALALFLYFSRAHGRVLELEQQLSAGVVLRQPVGWTDDQLGLGLTWGRPRDRGARDQYAVELYWRLQLTERIELTPDLQLLIRPANSDDDVEAVGGLRVRVFF